MIYTASTFFACYSTSFGCGAIVTVDVRCAGKPQQSSIISTGNSRSCNKTNGSVPLAPPAEKFALLISRSGSWGFMPWQVICHVHSNLFSFARLASYQTKVAEMYHTLLPGLAAALSGLLLMQFPSYAGFNALPGGPTKEIDLTLDKQMRARVWCTTGALLRRAPSSHTSRWPPPVQVAKQAPCLM